MMHKITLYIMYPNSFPLGDVSRKLQTVIYLKFWHVLVKSMQNSINILSEKSNLPNIKNIIQILMCNILKK